MFVRLLPIVLAVIAGFLLHAALVSKPSPSSNVKTPLTMSLSHGKHIVQLALRIYADDHDGRLPNTLYELFPNYLPVPADKMGFCYELRDWRYHYCDWLYFPQKSLSHAPPKGIVLAAPLAIKESTFDPLGRLVMLFDGTDELLSEDDFQARVIRDLRELNPAASTPNNQ